MSSPSPSHPSSKSLLLVLMDQTLVSLRKTSTSPATSSFQSHLAKGALGCFPARLPYISPQSSDLGPPSPELCEEMVVGLSLSSPHHQHLSLSALWILSFRCGPIAASSWQKRPAAYFCVRRRSSSEALPRGGVVLSLGVDVVRNPLGGRS